MLQIEQSADLNSIRTSPASIMLQWTADSLQNSNWLNVQCVERHTALHITSTTHKQWERNARLCMVWPHTLDSRQTACTLLLSSPTQCRALKALASSGWAYLLLLVSERFLACLDLTKYAARKVGESKYLHVGS